MPDLASGGAPLARLSVLDMGDTLGNYAVRRETDFNNNFLAVRGQVSRALFAERPIAHGPLPCHNKRCAVAEGGWLLCSLCSCHSSYGFVRFGMAWLNGRGGPYGSVPSPCPGRPACGSHHGDPVVVIAPWSLSGHAAGAANTIPMLIACKSVRAAPRLIPRMQFHAEVGAAITSDAWGFDRAPYDQPAASEDQA